MKLVELMERCIRDFVRFNREMRRIAEVMKLTRKLEALCENQRQARRLNVYYSSTSTTLRFSNSDFTTFSTSM